MAQEIPKESEGATPGVVIITGGGRAIGAAVALQVAALGHHVFINYVQNRTSADEVANEPYPTLRWRGYHLSG